MASPCGVTAGPGDRVAGHAPDENGVQQGPERAGDGGRARRRQVAEPARGGRPDRIAAAGDRGRQPRPGGEQRQRHREQPAIGPGQADHQTPQPGADELAPPEVVEGAERRQQVERLGIDRAEKQRERIRRDQPERGRRALVADLVARERIEIREREQERRQRHHRPRRHVRRLLIAEQQRDRPRRHRVRRKKHDVLLGPGAGLGNVAVAVLGDLQVPAGIPPQRQVHQLVVVVAPGRRSRRIAEHQHRQQTRQHDRRPRSREHRRSGPQRHRSRPLPRLLHDVRVDWLLGSEQMPDARDQQREQQRA